MNRIFDVRAQTKWNLESAGEVEWHLFRHLGQRAIFHVLQHSGVVPIRQLKKGWIFESIQYLDTYSRTLRALSFIKGALKDFKSLLHILE